MIDREQLIRLLRAQDSDPGVYKPTAERADAILAIPDPVHEAARELFLYEPGRKGHAAAMNALRAALAAEPVPTPITDGMVERAGTVISEWAVDPTKGGPRDMLRAALDAALNGEKR